MSAGRLEVRSLSKAFGAVVALDDVSAEFLPGEIHAVVGENGAGKSTLVGALSGFIVPNSGHILLDGRPLPLGDPQRCRGLGIEMVHQHFTLVPAFTVAENLALAKLGSLASGLSVVRLAEPSAKLAEHLGWHLETSQRASSMPVGAQQRLEVLKALSSDARVAIFDEPTAVLSPDEVADLFRVLRLLKERGKTIILIAHKLREVMSVADRVTVLRRGRKVAEARVSDTDEARVAQWMVGDLPQLSRPAQTRRQDGLTAADLVVRGDRGQITIPGASFEIARGEIMGFGGVDGNGQLEIAEALAGVRPIASGKLLWLGTPFDEGRPATAYIPQDRQEDGLALEMSVLDNLLITGHHRPSLGGRLLLRLRAIRDWASALVRRFEVRASGLEAAASSLSGGNQQKVVVARSLDVQPDLLVAANPTRGLDVRATIYVHERIREARAGGAAVALISTDLDELAALADRTVFLDRGRIVDSAWGLVGGAG